MDLETRRDSVNSNEIEEDAEKESNLFNFERHNEQSNLIRFSLLPLAERSVEVCSV